LLLPFALALDRPWTLAVPSTMVCAAVLGIALISTAFAFLLYLRILATAGANNLMLVNFLVPVSAVILGVAILGETLKPVHLVGMALIFVGLALRDGKARALIRHTSAATLLLISNPLNEFLRRLPISFKPAASRQ
jgi:drug/metabolite transporter (DMT)-like permease